MAGALAWLEQECLDARMGDYFRELKGQLTLEKAVGTTKKNEIQENQRLTNRVTFTNRVMVTIVLTPSFSVCFLIFVVVICGF